MGLWLEILEVFSVRSLRGVGPHGPEAVGSSDPEPVEGERAKEKAWAFLCQAVETLFRL
jgi:hypothetical protein